MTRFKILLIALLVSFAVSMVGCAKGGPQESSSNSNRAAAPDQAQNPLIRQDVHGDIERTSLAIAKARNAAKNGSWDEAVAELRSAENEVASALKRKPRISDLWIELNDAIKRTVALVEKRDDDSDARLAVLQQMIAAIKVQTGP